MINVFLNFQATPRLPKILGAKTQRSLSVDTSQYSCLINSLFIPLFIPFHSFYPDVLFSGTYRLPTPSRPVPERTRAARSSCPRGAWAALRCRRRCTKTSLPSRRWISGVSLLMVRTFIHKHVYVWILAHQAKPSDMAEMWRHFRSAFGAMAIYHICPNFRDSGHKQVKEEQNHVLSDEVIITISHFVIEFTHL